jgi:hypothetical protein
MNYRIFRAFGDPKALIITLPIISDNLFTNLKIQMKYLIIHNLTARNRLNFSAAFWAEWLAESKPIRKIGVPLASLPCLEDVSIDFLRLVRLLTRGEYANLTAQCVA